MKKSTLVLISLIIPLMVFGQGKYTVSGKITDANTGEELIGVSVYLKGSVSGTTTNTSGNYSLRLPADTLHIAYSFIGFEIIEHEIVLVKDTQINIALSPVAKDIEGIQVTAEKEKIIRVNPNEVSTISISPTLIAKLPNFGEVDIMRAFQLLPGVSGSNETSAGLYVHGGTPDQNLILFDGMTIYHVDHFYGFFSAFNANSVDDVKLYKGGFPAEYGGRTSSVLEITGKPADMLKFNIGGGISLLSANLFTEVPIVKNKLSVQASFRRSYTDVIRTPVYSRIFSLYNDASSSSGSGKSGKTSTMAQPDFYFYDLNAKITYKPGEKDLLTLSFYNGKDKLDNSSDYSKDGGINVGFTDERQWGNIGGSVGWERMWSEKWQSALSLSYSNYFSEAVNRIVLDTAGTAFSIDLYNAIEDNNVQDYSLRFGNSLLLSKKNLLKFGAQITYNDIRYLYTQNDTLNLLDQRDRAMLYAVYIHDEHTFFKRLHISGGLRATYFDLTGRFYPEPRFSAILDLPLHFKIKGAAGYYNQFINRTIREDVRAGSRDFWILADGEHIPVSSAIHYIGGVSWEPRGYLLGAEFFYKDMKGLSEFTLRYTHDKETANLEELFYKGKGSVVGCEFLAQKKLGKITGWLAYTYSRVVHTFPELNGGSPFYALHDQTHEVKAVYMQRLWRFDLSATWIYATGTPYTAPEGTYNLSLLDGTSYEFIHVSSKNSYRLPDYHRLDLAVNYNFHIKKAKAVIGLSVFNVYNHRNIWYRQYENDLETGELIETDITKLGITPNLSFRFNLR